MAHEVSKIFRTPEGFQRFQERLKGVLGALDTGVLLKRFKSP